MRHFVRDRIAAALERARPTLEEHIARHLEYPLGFPYKFAPAAVSIREVRALKVVPLGECRPSRSRRCSGPVGTARRSRARDRT